MSLVGCKCAVRKSFVPTKRNSGELIHVSMPHGNNGMRHADNLRSIRYYRSGKVVMNFRIGSYKLSSVDNKWRFYLIKGIK